MKKIIFVLSALLMLAVLGCKKNDPVTDKTMEQYYYTVEGKKYVLRIANKQNSNVVIAAPTIVAGVAHFNFGSTFTPQQDHVIFVDTDKSIIPLIYTMSFIDQATGNPLIDIASVYSFATRGIVTTTNTFENNKSQLKCAPLVDRIFYFDEFRYNFTMKYGQVVLNTDDFINPSNGLSFQFQSNLASAVNHSTYPPTGLNVPAGTYSIACSLLYFELQQ